MVRSWRSAGRWRVKIDAIHVQRSTDVKKWESSKGFEVRKHCAREPGFRRSREALTKQEARPSWARIV